MKDPCVTSVGAVEVSGHLVGYIYLVAASGDCSTSFWRYVESASGACYSNEELVILLSLIKSSLRIARWQDLQILAMAPGAEGVSVRGRGKPWL